MGGVVLGWAIWYDDWRVVSSDRKTSLKESHMGVIMLSMRCVLKSLPARGRLHFLVVLAALTPGVLCGQERVIIEHHVTTPEGDVIRAKADAALLMKQAELVGEKAQAQRLANMLTECDVAYKKMVTQSKTKGTLETRYQHTFDVIRFNQQLADIREELEQKAVMHRTRVGDPTSEMNSLLEQFARQHIQAERISAMRTELTPEQIDSLFLTDGSNVFSCKTGKTKLQAFKWPFFLQRKEFEEERRTLEAVCNQAVKETGAGGSLSPETVLQLLKDVAAIEEKVDAIPLSDHASVRSMETKWRREAKVFLQDLNQTLGNCSKLDSEKLSKYAFQGKTLGELIDHLNSKGLRFSQPGQQDANLYASIFFLMRYAYQEFEKGPTKNSAVASDKPSAVTARRVKIPANKPWPVSVRVKKGQSVHITAFGYWRCQPGGKKKGPVRSSGICRGNSEAENLFEWGPISNLTFMRMRTCIWEYDALRTIHIM